jgi:S-(hydroxymethyl)glutathione dehydrogenase/alcohol dehydrogenase
MTTTRAAVCTAFDQPLEILDLDLAPPGPGEVLVRVGASGVCHTDLSIALGRFPYELPIVLGHEGAGIVEAVGEGVDRAKPGDHVVLSWAPQCGECLWCRKGQRQLCGPGRQATMSGGLADLTPRFSRGDESVRQMAGLGTFAERLVAQQTAVIPIDPEVPFPVAALIGCGVMTGVGAAVNTATIERGDTVAVIGCGGVGLNVIQGSVLAGAERIIAIDRLAAKLDMAKRFGATDLVDAGPGDPVETVLELTGGIGVDVAFEVVGRPETAQQALGFTRAGGQACMVGMAAFDAVLPVSMALEFTVNEKRILGCNYGSANMVRDVPRMIDWWTGGQLQITELVSRTVGLGQVNEALDAVETGELARTVIAFDLD